MSFVFRLGVKFVDMGFTYHHGQVACVFGDEKVDVAFMRDSIGGYEVLAGAYLRWMVLYRYWLLVYQRQTDGCWSAAGPCCSPRLAKLPPSPGSNVLVFMDGPKGQNSTFGPFGFGAALSRRCRTGIVPFLC